MLRLFAVAAFGLMVIFGNPAAAQQPACTKRADVISHLGKKYKEMPSAIGLANNGGVIEVLSTKKGSTWTIIITMPNGTSCMIAAGENWQSVPQVAQVDPAT